MSDDITCPACGRSFDGSRAFNAHWGYQDDEAHQGDTPDDVDTSVVIDEEHREKLSEAKMGEERPPEYRKKIAEGMKGNTPWNKGLTKDDHDSLKSTAESHRGRSIPEETREKIAETLRQYHRENDIDMAERNMVWDEEENPFYIHGEYDARPEYPDEFSEELREQIRVRDGRICQSCGETDPYGRLHVHHIDRDKQNNSAANLVSLCSVCHKIMEYHEKKVQQMTYRTGPDTSWTLNRRVV